MNKTDVAVQSFKDGLRCSQAVLGAWAPDYDLDPRLAGKIAVGLAGGSALGGECGALTGAFLVLGLKYGNSRPEEVEKFWLVMNKVTELAQRFKSRHGALNCRELIGLDVFSEAGYNEFKEKNIKMTHCVHYVEDTMKLLEELML